MTGRALVTGGAVRLGRAMAEHLAARGFAVAVHYNGSEEAAAELCAAIGAAGGSAVALRADLLDSGAAAGLVPRAARALGGPLTLLVNNASIFEYDTLDTLDAESWRRHFASNLEAPVILTQHFARQAPEPGLDANGEPVAAALVVNMADQRVLKLTPHFFSYTLAKSALWTFTRTAAQALAPRVRVNAIGPGPTLRGTRQSPAHFATQRQATILRRGAGPDDVARALSYLIESPAVTGQILCTDGGQHLAWQTPDILDRG